MGTLKRRIIEAMEPTEYELARRWIPVEERLPENGKRVLVLAGVHDVCIAAYYPSRSSGDCLWLGDDEASYRPTHWMPLPSPPEVK